ncbi:Nn.00g037460.m01.CDS01 [Neocucurbitaria sp. VM-36]
MSLFGGSVPLNQSPYDSDTSQLSTASSLSPPAQSPQPQSAQDAQTTSYTLDPDIRLDSASQSGSDLEESDEDLRTRSNRFTGHPQTWKGYTVADRQIALSLEQVEQANLAAHLYNAHALKRRVRRPAQETAGLENWQSRDTWLKTGDDLQYTDVSGEMQKELVPSKDWTAWPLPPAKIPAPGEKATDRAGEGLHGEWMIGGRNTPDAGQEVREEMLAMFLRLAKETWEERASEDDSQRGRDRTTISRSRSRSKSVISTKSRRSSSRKDVEMEEGDDFEKSNEDSQQDDEEPSGPGEGRKRGRKSQNEVFAKPIITADDARAQRLLKPTINSMLSKLDDLALAVRRSRLNHFGRGESSDRSSMSEFTSGVDSGGLSSDSSTRSKSRSAPARKASGRPSSRATSVHTGSKAKKGKSVTRNQKGFLDSDIASNDASDSDASKNTLHKRKRPRSVSSTSGSSVSTNRDWSGRVGLLDWSEILGLAAVRGWDERAVARTAQRCAALFGESMSFMPFEESHASKSAVEPVHYVPSIIPTPDALPVTRPPVSRRPFYQIGTLRCPHTDCYGHVKDFALPYRVVEHCMRAHGYDPRTNDSDNEERTVGGAHIDGFLKPVTSKPGWLGHGRSKAGKASKKLKMGGEEKRGSPDAFGTVDQNSTLYE